MRRLLSYFFPETIEISRSEFNKRLEVTFENGRLTLNTEKVNYAFGKLDTVWRSAFRQIKMGKTPFKKIRILGLGPGNIVKIVNQLQPDCEITRVEIDDEVIRLGKKYFGLSEYQNLQIVVEDAVQFVSNCILFFDLICTDLFIDDRIPEGAEQDKFIRQCQNLLLLSGLILFNHLMHTPSLKKESERFAQKLKESFPGLRTMKADSNRVIIIQAPV